MPNKARNHVDMLQICCGICGIKKKQGLLRKITEHILMQIKCIDGYKDYNLSDDRFPKMICQMDRAAVHERYTNPKSTSYKFNLPINIPRYNEIILPHSVTRATPSDHTCFLCEQNKIGRPKEDTNNNSTTNLCNKCLQKTGRGIPHPCLKSRTQSVINITSKLEDLNPVVQDQVIHSVLKSKLDQNKLENPENMVKLCTAGHGATVQMNPSTSRYNAPIKTETSDKIRTQANLSINQTKLIVGGIQSDLGRKSIPPNYITHASKQINILKDFFNCEKLNFIIETKDSLPIKYDDIWAVWAPIVPLIQYINDKRNNSCTDNIIKIMADTGQGKTKICFCIIPNEAPVKRPRSTYAEGGILSKNATYSGINKCIMCFCSPHIKEVNWNLKKIFNLIGMDQLFLEYENVIFTGDIKLLNEVYGLMEASSSHPCIYCIAPKQELEEGAPRTIGSLKSDHEKWITAGAIKSQCKKFNNVKNYPLFTSLPDITPILKTTPPPSLHILLGVFNHIWKDITSISDQHSDICHKFAMSHNCVQESYWGKTFEGNECVKLLTHIEIEHEFLLLSLPGAENHIEALRKFNILRKLAFSNIIDPSWKKSLNEFACAYNNISGISKPLKVHMLIAHSSEFLEKYGNHKGLGFYSEQTGETIHRNFELFFDKYRIKNIHSEKYGIHLKKAVVEFGSVHI